MHKLVPVDGSFRDPSGCVYSSDEGIIRTINISYRPHWEALEKSGLLNALREEGKLPAFTEIEPLPGSWKTLRVEKIPFLSYPYEWSFLQLKDAALLTLELHIRALKVGLTLKDASAYNVQFAGVRPIFIDLLSFEMREGDAPWQAYRQFCMHFLAPLALLREEPRLHRLSALWVDGIPLDIAWKMLPAKKAFAMGLQMHLNLHSRMEQKYADGRKASDKLRRTKLSTQQLVEVAESLQRTIQGLDPAAAQGEWTDYYNDTNYSGVAEASKQEIVNKAAQKAPGVLALDLGANTGKYSRLLAQHFSYVVAADIDAQAVNLHYRKLRKEAPSSPILPLVLDLGNPSSGIGWCCKERSSWMDRESADCICALALTHHLFFSSRIPWQQQADFFARLLKPGGILIVEFVPREDSQVQRMLAARDDIFADYTLEAFKHAFLQSFTDLESAPVTDSTRVILTLQRNGK